jgi:hypothetical protein
MTYDTLVWSEYAFSGPAIAVQDGLEDMSHYDPEADRFGQDRDQVNQRPSYWLIIQILCN